MIVCTGSHALNAFNFLHRKPKDIDLICTMQEFKDLCKKISLQYKIVNLDFKQGHAVAKFIKDSELKIIEASFVDQEHQLQESDLRIYNYFNNECTFNTMYNFLGIQSLSVQVVQPWVVLMQKESHKYKKDSVHFLKTLKDLHYLRGVVLAKDHPLYESWLAERENLTYNNKLPVLKTSKMNFFTDSVPYLYDHDTIHEAVAILNKPAYTYYIADKEEVMCSKDKFFACSEEVRLFGVLEESYVLALERSVIPHGTDPKKAFDIALSKVCTSITSGWFREFAYDNYFRVQELYNKDYVQKFNKALSEGKIKSYQNK